ncbi:MAG: iron-containing alcohol dehydrogenase [Opitutaceae bacterium]|nr:iron-containing alcohol dehydrogenase [Opitutaceae bacterium]
MALINYLVPVHFAAGALRTLPEEIARLGLRAPLVVTDRGLVRAGLIDRLAAHVPGFDAARVFDGTPENPTEGAVRRAAALYREQGCDGIVAMGGGSPLDLAKGVALLATHPGPLARFAATAGGMAHITADVAPLIAIPTTAGTGSEVGRAAVLVLDDGRKVAVISPHLLPRSAICDPELTLSLPPRLTAGTGMDAIAHGLETFLSPADNPPADALALDGLARGVAHLPRAVTDGADLAARREMMMASLQCGLAFQKGLGAVHAMSHPLGALPGVTIHHGTANAILLPAVLRFNAPVCADKFARIRTALGLPHDADLAVFFRELAGRVGLPLTLRTAGVPRASLDALATAAALDFSGRTNPRPVTSADYRRLYEESHD